MNSIEKIDELISINFELEKLFSKYFSHLQMYLIKNIPDISSLNHSNRFLFTRPNYDEKSDAPLGGQFSTTFVLFSALNANLSLLEIERGFDPKRVKFLENEIKQSTPKPLDELDIEKQLVKKLQQTGIVKNYVDSLEKNDFDFWWFPYFDDAFDIYTTPFRLICYSKSLKLLNRERKFTKSVVIAIAKIVENLKKQKGVARFSHKHDSSAFLTYWAMNALYEWIDCIEKDSPQETWYSFFNHDKAHVTISHPRKKDEFGNYEKIVTTIESKYFPSENDLEQLFYDSFEWAKNQLYKLLTYYLGHDYERTDPIRCIYCLTLYSKYHRHRKTTKIQNIKPISNYNHNFVNLTIKHVLEEQQSFGLWKKYLPVLAIPSNDGNVYPFAVSTLAELIQITEPDDTTLKSFISGIRDVIVWIKRNEKTSYGYRQKSKVDRFLGNYSGWRSSHSSNPHGHPESWSTALVFDSINIMKKKVKKELTEEIIKVYHGKSTLQLELIKIFNPRNNLFKINVDFTGNFKELIDHFFVNSSNENSAKSGVLYGPPGTGKTSVAKYIAREKGWNYVRVDTSVLLKNGMEHASKTLTTVFDHLYELQNTVILFDEIDEFIRDRSDENTFNNRVLTNMMLTKINDLKENPNILYLVASNNFHKLDSAITRHGRFDYRVYVGFEKETIDEICEEIDSEIKKVIMQMENDVVARYSESTLRDFADFCSVNNKTLGPNEKIVEIIDEFKSKQRNSSE